MATAIVEAPTDVKQTYEKLSSKLKDLSHLEGINALLGWDEMVMMPPGAANSRAAQKAALAGVVYDKSTDKELGQLLDALRDQQGKLEEAEAAVVRDADVSYRRTTAIPKELAQRVAKLESDAYTAWVKAREASDVSIFTPLLAQWIEALREKAAHIDPSSDPYDVLLYDHEKGMTAERLDGLFKQVRDGLVPLIAAVRARGAKLSDEWIKGEYDPDTQAKLCKEVALDLGFNTTSGRLDVSVHPFSSGLHPTDVRMTTRFKKDDLMEGITGTIHETGHSLYEQGRNLKYDGLPVNRALSMGVHESQSLLWERMVGLSRPFAEYLLPKLKAAFPEAPAFKDADAAALYAASNVMREPSLIRVEADELTYPMHIILRYEIERGLLAGTIKVEDLSKVWNEKMKEYLGAEPPSDAQGCLQDIHWSLGAMSYFPTYTLGAMYAVQIFEAAKADIPDLDAKLAKGDFAPLKTWLNERVHALGSLPVSGDDLLTRVTGKPLDPSVFLAYLTAKYSDLYKL